jgi:F1F0 ATPase subunit 2
MNDILILSLLLGAGLLLGVFFFGGLWWTTTRAVVSRFPTLWVFGSFVVRVSCTLTVIYFVSRNHWERMLICLLGFIIARIIILRYIKTPKLNKIDSKGGGA